MDPNEVVVDGEAVVDPADAAAAAVELTGEAAELAAMDAALASVDAGQAVEVPVGDGTPPVEGEVVAEVAAVVDPAAVAETVAAGTETIITPDPVADEMKALGITHEKSQTRFRELSGEVARLKPLESAAANWQHLDRVLTDTGATPQQFGATLGYLKLVNSNDPADLSKAYDAMTAELQALGKRIGREAPGYDPLADHADLREEVAAGGDRGKAIELAQHRAASRLHTESREQAAARLQRERAEADEVEQAISDLNHVEDKYRRLDPDYDRKIAWLLPTIQQTILRLPHRDRAAAFESAYLNAPRLPAPVQTPAATPPARPAALSHQPLRPVGGGGAMVSQMPVDDPMKMMDWAIEKANGAASPR